MPTVLQWMEDGELHPEELIRLQTLLSPAPELRLEFRALEDQLPTLPPADPEWRVMEPRTIHVSRIQAAAS